MKRFKQFTITVPIKLFELIEEDRNSDNFGPNSRSALITDILKQYYRDRVQKEDEAIIR